MLGGVNRKELARYVAIGQVGLLMAVPPAVGVFIDSWLGWSPWGVVVGAAFGLTAGLVQLVRLTNQQDKIDESDKK